MDFGFSATALITGDFGAPGATSKSDPFELRAGPFLGSELRVLAVSGRERVNDVYTYDVTFATDLPAEALPAALFGEPACLTIKAPGFDPRVIQGLVASLEALGGIPGERSGKRRRYSLQIVPRLWLAQHRRQNRVFQNKSAPDIIAAILASIDIDDAEVHWRISKDDYPKLPFVYQRGESDYDFFRRVLADAGIFFYFEHANGLLDALLPGASAAAGLVGEAAGMLGGAVGGAVGSVASLTKSVTVLNFGDDAGHTPAVTAGLAAGLASEALGAGLGAAAGAIGGAIGGAAGSTFAKGLVDEDPSDTLDFDDGQGSGDNAERVYEFALKKTLRPKALRILDHDPALPKNWVGSIGTPSLSVSAGGVTAGLSGGLSGVTAGLSGALSGGLSLGASGFSMAGGGGVAGALTAAVHTDIDFDVDAPNIGASELRQDLYQVDPGVWQGPSPDKRMVMELERVREKYTLASGRSDSRRFGAAYRFTLDGHPIKLLNGEYTIVALDVEGVHPDFASDGKPVYRNKFRCIPSKVAPRPKRPKRRAKPGMEIATVVGFIGGEALPGLEANSAGYVHVRFHWDIVDDRGTPRGGLELGADDMSAVWIPVVQPWAGAGFGAQFIPREGMQVLVGFLEDQTERPIILGCLHSDANPPPWPGPIDNQKVGIRSQTRPANGGYSELSIDDRQGGELVQIRAQRDLAVEVLRESRTNVQADRYVTVGGSQTTAIKNDESIEVEGDRTTRVVGKDALEVQGDRTEHVVGSRTITIDASKNENVTGDVSIAVSGAVDTSTEDTHTERFGSDYVQRHAGHRVVIVGDAQTARSTVVHTEGAVRLYGAGAVEAVSPLGLTITCGKSAIRITPEAITFSSPTISLVTKDVEVTTGKFVVSASDAISHTGKNVNLASSGASFTLDSNVSAQGSQIKLAGGSGSSSSANDKTKVTTITLNGPDGKPLADQRVLLRKGGEGGEERMVVLDAKGTFEMEGDDAWDATFPDVTVS